MNIAVWRCFVLSLAASQAIASCAGPRPERTPTLPAPALGLATKAAASPPTPQPAEATPIIAAEASAQATAVPAPTSEEPSLYKGIPHGVTANGFFYLGQADAPVTLTGYSDFL